MVLCVLGGHGGRGSRISTFFGGGGGGCAGGSLVASAATAATPVSASDVHGGLPQLCRGCIGFALGWHVCFEHELLRAFFSPGSYCLGTRCGGGFLKLVWVSQDDKMFGACVERMLSPKLELYGAHRIARCQRGSRGWQTDGELDVCMLVHWHMRLSMCIYVGSRA